MRHLLTLMLGGASFAALSIAAPALAQTAASKTAEPTIGDSDIGGIVAGPRGPEAGVWVIATTGDLPTKYAKMVVTDDQGRYVLPDLPKANFTIFARGYGLVDSAKAQSQPGRIVDIAAVPAPNEAAAAHYYPGMYWYSMLTIPPADQFPGTGVKGNGIPAFMKTQAYWIDTVKNSCQSCHALGSENVREPKKELGDFKNSADLWQRRLQSGQAMGGMSVAIARLGPDHGYQLFGDWTDRIAKGELPSSKPERPKGVERNVVITSWDWMSATSYAHDAASTDKRNPTVNANGYIYGSPEDSTDDVPVLDPVHHKAWSIKHPWRDADTPTSHNDPMGPSAFWGDEPIWDSHTTIHNLMFDGKGRVWFTARIRKPENPPQCKQGSDLPSAQETPIATSGRQLSVYDPKTEKFTLIDTCFGTHHLYFGHDKDETLWTSAGGPTSIAIGWLDTKKFDETGDAMHSQAWAPLVLDTNANGKRDAYVDAKAPVDPTKDKRVIAGFYGVQPSPVDDTIWGQAMDVGFSRVDQPGYIIRFDPKTKLSEIYLPPEGGFGSRGIDLDLNGLVWTVLASGHLASFDRAKCKGALNGPNAVDGNQCPEGWTLYRFPGPQFKNVDSKGSAEHAYYIWVDRYNTLGLGANVPIAMANGGEALLALVNGEFVTLRIPYPLGFFSKNADGRIDDPNAGWKGRGLWTTSGTRAMFHNEGGKGTTPKVFHVQMRPDPLAR